jgi:DNA-directed RNA polymerase subunit RPC12/RpoP
MDVREKYVMQKVNRKEKSICPNCIHHNLCIAENNQPCFECNRFIDAQGVTVQECGHWEDDHGDYVCSCCHTAFTDDLVWLVRGESNEPNYCPNCGAKMMPQPPKGE